VGRPYSSLPVPEGAYRKDVENNFSRACCERTRSNDFKLREGRFRLDIRKKFFTIRGAKHWNLTFFTLIFTVIVSLVSL